MERPLKNFMSWEKSSGAAIAIRPFLPTGNKQLPLLKGDKLEILGKCKDWFRGKNILTKVEGIFPQCCVTYMETDPSLPEFFRHKDDLLLFEAKVIIRLALDELRKTDKPPTIFAITSSIAQVIKDINLLQSKMPKEHVATTHKNLSNDIDALRITLEMKATSRSDDNSPLTLTTWSSDMFNEAKHVSRPVRPLEYIILHFNVIAHQLKKGTYFRFFLYQHTNRKEFIAQPITRVLDPDNTNCELLFTQLEKKNMKEQLFLVIYAYEQHSGTDDLEIISCATIELPSCRTESSFKKPPVELNPQAYSSKDIMYQNRLHEFLIDNTYECMKTVEEANPKYTVYFKPYSGELSKIIEENRLDSAVNILPSRLPLVLPVSQRQSFLQVTISGINQHSSRKKTRLVIRLKNDQNQFLNIVEKPDGHAKVVTYDAKSWHSAIFKCTKGKEIPLNETFVLDLRTAGPLDKLNIIVEVQRMQFGDNNTISSSYAVIPLSSQNGSFTSKTTLETAKLHHFKAPNPAITDYIVPPISRECGEIEYSLQLASTIEPVEECVYTLLNFQNFKKDYSASLKHIQEIGTSEWRLFFKRLTLNMCLIQVTDKKNRDEAFNVMIYMISEILKLGRQDYIKQIDELILQQFNEKIETSDHSNLMHLHELMFPLALQMINQDDTKPAFRNCIKCSPYYMELMCKSLIIHQKKEKVDTKQFKEMTTQIFDKLSSIMKEVVPDDNPQRKGFVFTNQWLILQHVSRMIKSLLLCFQPEEVAVIVEKFIKSIRYVPSDRKQIPTDKGKMRVLLSIASSKLWEDSKSRKKLEKMFTDELTLATTLNHCVDFVIQILASLFVTERNKYIIQFIPFLKKANERKGTQSMNRFLLTIANTFPHKFPLDLLFTIVDASFVCSQERFFVYASYVQHEETKLKELMSNLKQNKDDKHRVIRTYLSLGNKAAYSEIEPVDYCIQKNVYPQHYDYSIVHKLFKATKPDGHKIMPTVVLHLLHCYILNNSIYLRKIMMKMLKADYWRNQSFKEILNPVLDALFTLTEHKSFMQVAPIFQGKCKSEPVNMIVKRFSLLVENLFDIKNLETKSANEDQLAEALVNTINLASQANHKDIQCICIEKLAELELNCENYIEAARAHLMILPFVKCDHSPAPKFLSYQNLTGRVFHETILFAAIELFIKANYDEYAIPLIKQLIDTCVLPFKYFELMNKIKTKESQIYKNIGEIDRSYSNFYFIGFYGHGFNGYYANRAFIYRRGFFEQYLAVKGEFQTIFPQATISTDPPTEEIKNEEKGQYIQLLPTEPSSPDEAKDAFFRPDIKRMKYHIQFEKFKSPNTFRYDKPINRKDKSFANEYEGSTVGQTYYFTQEAFPAPIRRLEIDNSKTTSRTLNPIEHAIISVRKRTDEIATDAFLFDHMNKMYDKIDPKRLSNFTMALKGTCDAAVNGGTKMYIGAFLSERYEKLHPDHRKFMIMLKDSLNDQLKVLEDSLPVHRNVIEESVVELHEVIMDSFHDLKKELTLLLDTVLK